MAEITYCDLTETDDYYVSDKHVFETQVFATQNPRKYSYERSINPRDKASFKTTPFNKVWGNVWCEIDKNQSRASGKRRNRYHVISETKRIIKPATVENVPVPVTIDNPLGGTFTTTRYVRHETPPTYADVELIYFDIDDMIEIEAFKILPTAIWARSPGGRCHVFVLILPADYQGVRDKVAEWMYHHHVGAENSIVPKRGKTLDSILVPGQDEWTLPCQPGMPDHPIVNDYHETIALFVEHYQNNRVEVDKAFPIFPRNFQSPEILAQEKPPIPNGISVPKVQPETHWVTRNTFRLGDSCNIPSVHGALTITRRRGQLDEQHFEYRTIDDCKDEGDGFHISWSYFAALMRKHRGDSEQAHIEYVENRQKLRTVVSKKHQHKVLLTDARAMKRYADRTWDPGKLKHSDRDEKDRAAMNSVNRIRPHTYSTVIQRRLRQRKAAIVKKWGSRVYQVCQQVIHPLTEDVYRYNGRIAHRSKKSRENYCFGDSRAMLDYVGIEGNKRLLSNVVDVLKKFVLLVDDPHNWGEAKCTRYTYHEEVLSEAEQGNGERVKGTGNKNRIISFTNVGSHGPSYATRPIEELPFWQVIDEILGDIDEMAGHPVLN